MENIDIGNASDLTMYLLCGVYAMVSSWMLFPWGRTDSEESALKFLALTVIFLTIAHFIVNDMGIVYFFLGMLVLSLLMFFTAVGRPKVLPISATSKKVITLFLAGTLAVVVIHGSIYGDRTLFLFFEAGLIIGFLPSFPGFLKRKKI